MRIAICDDESEIRTQLRKTLLACNVLPDNASIDEFANGSSLVQHHKQHPFDIIFLDIQMPDITGLEAGKEIKAADWNSIVIFLTSHTQYMSMSFRIEPLDFLTKPIDEIKIGDVLRRALEKYRREHYLIEVKWRDSITSLDVRNVVYIKSEGREVEIITNKSNEQYKKTAKLDTYEKCLAHYGFFRCHQRYLINMGFIKSIENSIIHTRAGYDVPMSVRKKKECLGAYGDFRTRYLVGI